MTLTVVVLIGMSQKQLDGPLDIWLKHFVALRMNCINSKLQFVQHFFSTDEVILLANNVNIYGLA